MAFGSADESMELLGTIIASSSKPGSILAFLWAGRVEQADLDQLFSEASETVPK